MGYSNSPLVTYTQISPNKTANRKHQIDTITIHCFAAQVNAQRGCSVFQPTTKQASCNYVIGYDGSIGLVVEEKDRSWCSSSSSNDDRAITIEVSSDNYHPYAVTDAAYKALIDLLVDICQRNNIKQLLWKADKNLIGQVDKQNMTVHRWFANKACPGDWLYERHGAIAAEVNKRLIEEEDENMTKETFKKLMDEYLEDLANEEATWEQADLAWAQKNGLMAGDAQGKLSPKKFITRGEVAAMLHRNSEK